jgi:hypothetical protein
MQTTHTPNCRSCRRYRPPLLAGADACVVVARPGSYYAPNFYAAFKKAGLTRFAALVDRAGLRGYFSDPALKITAWPPRGELLTSGLQTLPKAAEIAIL